MHTPPLPAVAGAPAAREAAEPPDVSRRVAVVVDDCRGDSDLHCHLLRLEGIETVAAEDGWEALVCVRRLLPDLVVTDLRMPGLDGWGLIERLRAAPQTAGIPVLVVTGAAGAGEDPRSAQAARVLDKPLQFAEFRAAAHRALRGVPWPPK